MGRTRALAALAATVTLTGLGLSIEPAAAATVYQPAQYTNWQWMLNGTLNTGNQTQMGTGVTAYNGDTAPGDDPQLYDIDGIENSAATVTTLHNLGKHVVCYIEVGTAGSYYTKADEGIPKTYYDQLNTAGDLGRSLPGYPQEKFININKSSAVSIIESMIQQQCAAKGFDAVETDLDETFDNNEGNTNTGSNPFTISQATEENYLRTLSTYMHGLGLGWIAKNLDDTHVGATFVSDMQPYAQGMISEDCNQNGTCSYLGSFLSAGKWIGNAEYKPETANKFCASDNAANLNGIFFPSANLNGPRQPCR